MASLVPSAYCLFSAKLNMERCGASLMEACPIKPAKRAKSHAYVSLDKHMQLADLNDAYSRERPSFPSVGLLRDGDARSRQHPPGNQMRLMIRGLR